MPRRTSEKARPLSRLGEFGLIRQVRSLCPKAHPRVRLGIGDDTAILRPSPNDLLLTTDLLIESRHFDFRFVSPYQVGAKAILVNASDIAAMGGIPETVVASLAVSPSTPVSRVNALYRGIVEACRSINADLVGGDTSASPGPMFLNIAMTGSSPVGRSVRRSGGKAGDQIYVTGTLGDSRIGLRLLRSTHGTCRRADASFLIQRHLCPTPRIAEGLLLARSGSASAMIDVSDGLASDLRHLCAESGTGACIDVFRLPISRSLSSWCCETGRDPFSEALLGGEDYELLFAVPPHRVRRIEGWIEDGRLDATRIGSLTASRSGLSLVNSRGSRRPMRERGFRHF